MKTFRWYLEDQSVPLVLLVRLVLGFLQVLSTTSAAIDHMHLRVLTSHDLDLQLLRLQTHMSDAALSCRGTVDFSLLGSAAVDPTQLASSTPLTFSPFLYTPPFFPHPFIYPLPIRTPFYFFPLYSQAAWNKQVVMSVQLQLRSTVIFSGT